MNRLARILATAALFAAGPALAAPKTIDLKGQTNWTSEAPVEKIVGTADGQGTLTGDLDDLSTLRGELKFTVASMKSGNEQRDEHLKGSDWLEADKHPDITFVVDSVKVVSAPAAGDVKEAKVDVTGRFTLHGVTTPLTAPATLKWKDDKVKIDTAFVVKLADYKVAGKQGVVGSKVGETIDVKVSLRGVAK